MIEKTLTLKDKLIEKEAHLIGPFGCSSKISKGRARIEASDPLRLEFQIDKDRILHSKAFRRLKHKTQVFFAPFLDHFRTRLTHTLEVSQISRTISRILALNEDLTEAIALGHDLGHTPFGHSGEEVLNGLLKGGFKHSLQSVRVVELIEDLNLTFETIDGIKCHSFGKAEAQTLEGQVVKISDKIAYINHDIDDALRAKVITIDMLPKDCLKVLGANEEERANTLINDIYENSYSKPLIRLSEEKWFYMNKLRAWMFENVYLAPFTTDQLQKAKSIVEELFEYAFETLKIDCRGEDEDKIAIAVADYIASMSDRYAIVAHDDIDNSVHHDVLLKFARINGLNIND